MAHTIKAVPNPHDPADVKYHVMTEPTVAAVYDTEEEAKRFVMSKPPYVLSDAEVAAVYKYTPEEAKKHAKTMAEGDKPKKAKAKAPKHK